MNEGDLFDDLPEPAEEKPAPRRPAAASAEPEPATEPVESPLVEPVTEPAENPVVEAVTEPVEPPVIDAVEEPAESPVVDAIVSSEPPCPADPEPPAEETADVPERRKTALPRAESLGRMLSALRRNCGMDLNTVADETRIKASYLEALENDDFSELPHMVYALAYVKKLCGVYGLSDADADELMEGLREQLAYEIPDDIDKSVICREQDEETRRKLQQISIALIAGAALIILLLVIGGTTLVLRSNARKNVGRTVGEPRGIEEQLAEDRLEWYRQQPQLKTTRIDLAPRRGK